MTAAGGATGSPSAVDSRGTAAAPADRAGATARCTVCASARVSRDPFYYAWRDREWWITRCRECSHQFVFPSVTAADQAIIYGDQYFSRDGDWVCGIFDADYISAEPQLREEAREILGMIARPGGRLLDIGCAGGFFLDEARKAGFAVAGIELNEVMAAHAREALSLDVAQGRIEDIPVDRFTTPFDVVVILDCLEHIPDPRGLMQKVAAWTQPDATLFIRGPLVNSAVARGKEAVRRMLGATKQLPGYPLDANAFNKHSLSRLIGDAGFRVDAWLKETGSFANLRARRVR